MLMCPAVDIVSTHMLSHAITYRTLGDYTRPIGQARSHNTSIETTICWSAPHKESRSSSIYNAFRMIMYAAHTIVIVHAIHKISHDSGMFGKILLTRRHDTAYRCNKQTSKSFRRIAGFVFAKPLAQSMNFLFQTKYASAWNILLV